MSTRARSILAGLRSGLRPLLYGPQLLAFLPAITLAAYWIGGETALVLIALLMPAIFALGGLYVSPGEAARAPRDPVTGLVLRASAVEAADRLLADGPTRAGSAAAVAIGIDEFDKIAERNEAAAVDAILLACADRVTGAIRGTDIVARLDGPRFAIVLTAGSRANLEALIQLSARIQRAVEEPISLAGNRIFVTVSVGFCTPKNAAKNTGEALLRAAEQALTDATAQGTSAIRAFSPEMQERAQTRIALADELPIALESEQIRPWFQPQVSAESGAITGFEVLARWEHPSRGTVPPAQFLSAAEDLGLMERLGEVMLFQALSTLRTWDSAGLNVPGISMNFAAEELRNPMLVDKVQWELDRFGIDSSRLTVEVLETVIAQTSNDTIIRNLRAFAELGCMIDLDDFGTGHASITNIKRFSVGRIKIDRSFVTHLDTDLEQQNIVSAILTLATRLELDTLAEGVETPAEHAVLRKLGCQHLQGYGIAKPMPFADVEPWIGSYRARLASAPGEAPGSDGKATSEQPRSTGKTA